MTDKPIGIIDSGVGGLTITKEIIRELPHESIVYIADSKNTPYGNRSQEEIYALSQRLIDFLLTKQVKMVVIACNTITVSSIKKLRQQYPNLPIVGTVPVVKTATKITKNKRIGILSTTHTAQSDYQKDLIKNFADGHVVINYGSDELVPLIEQGRIDEDIMVQTLENILAIYKKEAVDTLALGCTHFPFIKHHIQEILGDQVQILDSGPAIARQVKKILEHNNIRGVNKPTYAFYTTGKKEPIQKLLTQSLGLPEKVTVISI